MEGRLDDDEIVESVSDSNEDIDIDKLAWNAVRKDERIRTGTHGEVFDLCCPSPGRSVTDDSSFLVQYLMFIALDGFPPSRS